MRRRGQGPGFLFWALFRRRPDGSLSRLPVVFSTRAGARQDKDHDEVIRRVFVVTLTDTSRPRRRRRADPA